MSPWTALYGVLSLATLVSAGVAYARDRRRLDALVIAAMLFGFWVTCAYVKAHADDVWSFRNGAVLDVVGAGAVMTLYANERRTWKLLLALSFGAQCWLSAHMPDRPNAFMLLHHAERENALFVFQLLTCAWGAYSREPSRLPRGVLRSHRADRRAGAYRT